MSGPEPAGWARNRALAQLFNRYADLLEIVGGEEARKAPTYRRAAIALRNLERPVEEVADPTTIPGIGPVLARKIREFLDTGRIAALERLAAEVPPGLLELLALPGVGPKTVGTLWRSLGVASPGALAAAAREGRLRELPGFGPKREAALLAALTAERRGLLLSEATTLGQALVERLGRAALAGETRRGCPLTHELVLVAEGEAATVAMRLGELAIWREAPAPAAGRVSATLEDGTPLTVVVAGAAAFGTALVAATGSPAHLAELGELPVAATEEALYAALGLPWIAPELREGTGEVAAARAGALPVLLCETDVRGDLHVHSRWSDGSASIAELAAAARARGDDYLAITDHSRSLVVAHGLGPEELRRQRREIEAAAAASGLRILQGCEVEVLRDGSLDLDDATLRDLDFVIASLHSRFGQDGPTLTRRAVAALSHPLVDMLGHPSGRRLPEREPYPLDLDRVIEAAADHGKALEVNGSPERCDLDGAWVRRARARGVPLAVVSDAHSVAGLAARAYGVRTARRGWLGPEGVLNARPAAELAAWLRRRRGE